MFSKLKPEYRSILKLRRNPQHVAESDSGSGLAPPSRVPFGQRECAHVVQPVHSRQQSRPVEWH